ncbi:tetratricopeptide repeat protein [Solibacillus silvestris]|uniref:tetratricopeptide repeat protein n=1 Tax=Solibacillus silvestris TaxID=76853 RepID=UPI003F8075F5
MKENKSSGRQGKVILFPGMMERLLNEAKVLAENQHYEEAIELFEQALELGEGDEISLSVFAYSLYEAKNFERAKQVCEELLAIGPNMYFEVMELYLTICMQLRQFKQVEKIIESLFDEELIPDNETEKFERLKNLNAHIAENQESQLETTVLDDDDETGSFELNAGEFLRLPVQEQLLKIHELTEKNVRPFAAEIKAIIESQGIHPFILSLLLILLVEQEVNMNINVAKFDEVRQVNPVHLPLPTKLPQYEEVASIIMEQLVQEPSTLEFVQHLMAKHSIVLYPFEWAYFGSEDIALSYINFVKSMFGEASETDDEAAVFLQNLEKISDLQE